MKNGDKFILRLLAILAILILLVPPHKEAVKPKVEVQETPKHEMYNPMYQDPGMSALRNMCFYPCYREAKFSSFPKVQFLFSS